MEKRKLIIGTYDTALNGWTLAEWALSAPEMKTNFVNKFAGDGSWDLSTALTDGVPRYFDRELTATLECSEGDRLSRETEIRRMINLLDGMRFEIRLPDDAYHYIVGRVYVARNFNDLAHASVSVRATCEPWKYSSAETVVALSPKSTKQTVTLVNSGRRAVVPVLAVTGSGASVLFEYGTASLAMTASTRQWPALVLTPGAHALAYSGSGAVLITYREAVLE